MTEPPLLDGAVYETVACALPAVAVPIVGASGIVFVKDSVPHSVPS